ncbi:hypothetical protein B7P43_G06758 [Cryptotermes secundus]|uniref:Uncharacterized protein n=1 Tax=Cryptotermes secundus TaxID=105785 RepID=A0A2J7RIB9_9NEOP|nr:hypothetical protein B7P43_G06758 [Cryptotermes secundus]
MFARVLLHSVCTVLELGFFCWFGSELMHKSQRVHQAAYDCDWQNNCNGAKFICMIIMRAQRPVAVRAGLFGNLCLPTFSSVSRCNPRKFTQVTMKPSRANRHVNVELASSVSETA